MFTRPLSPEACAMQMLDHVHTIVKGMHKKAINEGNGKLKAMTEVLLSFHPVTNPIRITSYLKKVEEVKVKEVVKGIKIKETETKSVTTEPMTQYEIDNIVETRLSYGLDKKTIMEGIQKTESPREPKEYLADLIIFARERLVDIVSQRQSSSPPPESKDSLLNDLETLYRQIAMSLPSQVVMQAGVVEDEYAKAEDVMNETKQWIDTSKFKLQNALEKATLHRSFLEKHLNDLTIMHVTKLKVLTQDLIAKYDNAALRSACAYR